MSLSDRGKKLLNHTALRTRQSNIANPQTTNPQLQEIRLRSSKSGNVGLWDFIECCGFLCFSVFKPTLKLTNPQTQRTHATHKPTRFSCTRCLVIRIAQQIDTKVLHPFVKFRQNLLVKFYFMKDFDFLTHELQRRTILVWGLLQRKHWKSHTLRCVPEKNFQKMSLLSNKKIVGLKYMSR